MNYCELFRIHKFSVIIKTSPANEGEILYQLQFENTHKERMNKERMNIQKREKNQNEFPTEFDSFIRYTVDGNEFCELPQFHFSKSNNNFEVSLS